MRVLSVGFPQMPVGTGHGGGAEQILSIIERGLTERGHQSVVVAGKGSRVVGDLMESASAEEHRQAIARVLANGTVNLIHFHGLDFPEYLPDCATPMLATLHLPVSLYPAWIFGEDRRGSLTLNCVSRSQADSTCLSRRLPFIPNGIPTELYAPAEAQDYLLWLGRICPEKGVDIALQVAHRLDAPLIIAGPVHPYRGHIDYFSQSIKPRLDDRRTYAGPVELNDKVSLLAHARCLLIPSLVAETSSLVAMEALSSGTPVVAFRTGALPEIVEDGETGFIVDSAEKMARAVSRIEDISRAGCRSRAVARFCAGPMIEEYLSLYGQIMAHRFAGA